MLGMNHQRTSSIASPSLQSAAAHQSFLSNPYELRHGRRCLRELPYPLPVDLIELHRQNLRTLLACKVVGRAVCSPIVEKNAPQRVLEIGCGSGLWSAMCHDHFSPLGHAKVAFTGLDVATLAPDLSEQGVNWTFIQHDLRRHPLPFDDEYFDLIMLKDLSLVVPQNGSTKFFKECVRLLRKGGNLEIWDSSHVLRSLVPRPNPLPKDLDDSNTQTSTATFHIDSSTQFAPAQNQYLQEANVWIQEALDRRKLPPTPCITFASLLEQHAESLSDIGSRQVAVPFGELRWERDGPDHNRTTSDPCDSVLSKRKSKKPSTTLTGDQTALRQTALTIVLQGMESLEPLLKEVSGKNSEEWNHWWAAMMAELLSPSKVALTSECLEFGAWWATKVGEA